MKFKSFHWLGHSWHMSIRLLLILLITDLKDDLFEMGEWCSNNLLLLSPDKAKLMIFGCRQMRAKLQFHSLPFMGKDIVPQALLKIWA